ncbi:DarT ssDNA thymidine ADP-ribosyltransferase family protein [Macrococcus equi]|uniref:DarT ssDNA thymidine ADP-ribosyltransferase family protein n=1 Tax=Macrococcus equi TaxID=3395462 RepID=UPI0039BDB089
MDKYKELIAERNITRLCHFTKTKNLPFILGNGVYTSNGIVANNFISDSSYLEKIDSQRLDKHEDYVCTSIQYPNPYYFSNASQRNMTNVFNEWSILMISPEIINETSKFSPVNAAKKSGALIESGFEAFANIFNNLDPLISRYSYERTLFHPNNLPTDLQAEVLIFKKIDIKYISDIIFSSKTAAEFELMRLKLCGIDLNQINIKYAPDLFLKDKLIERVRNNTIHELEEFSLE